eukprot:4673424-Prymnesium_polylepis.1
MGNAHAARCARDAEWAARASCADGGAALALRVESWRTVVLEKVRPTEALALARALAQEPSVLWVEPHAQYLPLNADAAQITQSGSTPLGGVGAGGIAGTPVGTTPIWDMGLHGEGEVIGPGLRSCAWECLGVLGSARERAPKPVSYTHLRAHETLMNL